MSRFCTALSQVGDLAQPCTRRARPGQDFCYSHLPAPTPIRWCAYLTLRGEPCRSPALRGQDHCFVHSPRNWRRKLPPTPLIPRTRRQKALFNRLVFRGMPHA